MSAARSGPELMLTDTISRVAISEQRLDQLDKNVATVAHSVNTVSAQVEEVAEQGRRLAAAVEALAGDDEADSEAPAVLPRWAQLNQDEAHRAWIGLNDWLLGVLVPVYEVTVAQLHGCWPAHPAIREELSWLRACWIQAYEADRGASAAEWHTRWLPGCLDRIAAHFKRAGCSQAAHRKPKPGEFRADPATPETWWRDAIDADIRNRPPGTPA